MSNSNKNNNITVSINNIFYDLDTYLLGCIQGQYKADPIQVRRSIDTIKDKVHFCLSANADIQNSIDSLNDAVNVLKCCNDTYFELNDNNEKIMSNNVEIQNKQLLINKDLSGLIYKLADVIKDIINPIRVALNMKTADKKSVNNPNFKGLTDDKLQELLDLGYNVNDILIYTSDPSNSCGHYSRSAIYTRINKLKNKQYNN